MPQPNHSDVPWVRLIAAGERMATTRSLDAIVEILRETAREIVGADGITVVIREGDSCFYAAEDAIGPLWTGSRFPASTCVSGWAMINGQTAIIPDIRADPRIPQDTYRSTFVRSLIMAPIGVPQPIAAIGAYWSTVRDHDPSTVVRLEALARSAAVALENARLIASIEQSEHQRRIAIAAGRMGVWQLILDTGELIASETCKINFGRDPKLPFTYAELRAAIHPDDLPRVLKAIDDCLTLGVDYDVEYRLRSTDGIEHWIGIRGQALSGADGKPLSMSGVSIDITERKRMEEQARDLAESLEARVVERTRELVATQEALRHAQKLEAMGQLTGGVAHDFNNLLTPILGSLDVLKRRDTGDAREQRLIDGALQSAERARTLVQRLLAFARRQPLNATAVDMTALVIEMSPLIGTTVGPQVELILDIAEDLPLARADQNQVEMAILNLAVNARDAMPDGGRLIVSAHPVQVTEQQLAGLTPGAYVRIGVIDNGHGMDEETRRRAIEPFFSTKGIGKGTGLGLSMAHGLAGQLGGGLTITSQPGVGTAVELWLPATAEPLIATTRTDMPPASRSGTVLVVDDDPLVRATTVDMLVELGFEVIQAESGADALGRLEERPDIDLLVTDHLMPLMTGVELATIARSRWTALRVLIISGYSDTIGIAPDLPRLEKPFRQADLAATVAAVMDSIPIPHR